MSSQPLLIRELIIFTRISETRMAVPESLHYGIRRYNREREKSRPMNFAGVWSLIGKTLIAHWQLEVKRKDFRLFQAVIPADTVRMWQELQQEMAGRPQGVTQAWHRRVNFWS